MNEDETFYEFYIELSDIVNSCFDLNDFYFYFFNFKDGL